MSEKYKVLRNAEKYVVAGRFAHAVREYRKLLDKEPDEPTVLNTVGDLLLRQNQREEALGYFHRAAEVYLRSGFLLKTIAVYRKIHQFDPANSHVNESLAELYQRQGLAYEASRHLRALAAQAEEMDQFEKACTYFQRLVELSPENGDNEAKLAELMEKRRDEAGAFDHYRSAAALYLEAGSADKAFETVLKAMETDPTDDRTVGLYVKAALKSGKRDSAKERLAELVQTTGQRLPYEIYLAQIFEAEGDTDAAYAKYLELELLGGAESRVREGLARTSPRAEQAGQPLPSPEETGTEFTFEEEPRVRVGREKVSGPATDWLDLGDTTGGGIRPQATDGDVLARTSEGPAGGAFTTADGFQASSREELAKALVWGTRDVNPVVEEEEEEVFEPLEEVEESAALPEPEESPIESLDEALQEVDFYLKLGFREEARRLLERLLHTYPSEERVRRRAAKVMTVPPPFDNLEIAELVAGDEETEAAGVSVEAPLPAVSSATAETVSEARFTAGGEPEAPLSAEPSVQDSGTAPGEQVEPPSDVLPSRELEETARGELSEPEFEEEMEFALDSLFSGEDSEEAADEVLRYDVAASEASDEATNPKVHYDLGLAYKEMGLVEDAIQEFQTAVQLLDDPQYSPQRILCCSMLANSLLQLGRFGEANHWADEGLRIPGKKEFEWKALKYDWSSSLERQGKYPEALEGFREILDRDPSYRDVPQRIDHLLQVS